MVIFNGLLGLILLPFIILGIGIWMCWFLLKMTCIVIVGIGCATVELFGALAERRARRREEAR